VPNEEIIVYNKKKIS